jgi:hypothetical protein
VQDVAFLAEQFGPHQRPNRLAKTCLRHLLGHAKRIRLSKTGIS